MVTGFVGSVVDVVMSVVLDLVLGCVVYSVVVIYSVVGRIVVDGVGTTKKKNINM